MDKGKRKIDDEKKGTHEHMRKGKMGEEHGRGGEEKKLRREEEEERKIRMET